MLSLQSFSTRPRTVPSLSPFAFSSSTIRLNTAPQVSTFWLEAFIYSVAKSLHSDATGSLAEAQLLTSLSSQGIVSSKSYYDTNLTLAHMGPLFIVGH